MTATSTFARDRIRGVHQTILGHDANTPGNCTQAAVATILDKPLELVPHFVELTLGDPRNGAWFPVLQSWTLDRYGFTWILGELDDVREVQWADDPRDVLLLGAGRSPRGKWGHSIVVDGNLDLVWDPSPAGGGVAELWDVILPVAPDPVGELDGLPLWSVVRLPEAAR